jgi:large subunit ribosomal protein L10
MVLKIKDKKIIVAEFARKSSLALSAATASCRGLSSNQMNDLRKQAEKMGVYLKVVRNSLAKRAVEDTGLKCIIDVLHGSTIFALSESEPSAPAKLFKSFMLSNKNFRVKNLVLSGKIFSSDKLNDLSKLPNRREAISLLCGTIQSPISNITRIFHSIPTKLVATMKCLEVQKNNSIV